MPLAPLRLATIFGSEIFSIVGPICRGRPSSSWQKLSAFMDLAEHFFLSLSCLRDVADDGCVWKEKVDGPLVKKN